MYNNFMFQVNSQVILLIRSKTERDKWRTGRNGLQEKVKTFEIELINTPN